MKKFSIFLCLALLLYSCSEKPAPQKLALVPEPVSIQTDSTKVFVINKHTTLSFLNLAKDSETQKYIVDNYRHYFGFEPKVQNSPVRNIIIFELNEEKNELLGEEGYQLTVDNKIILISANTEAGLFYGFQTLFQLAPTNANVEKPVAIGVPGVKITDYPRFEWRGSHLDVCRHFFNIDEVKKHLDVMALYKLNKFHFHLTDDHGWRIQIDKYPLLTEVGAWRVDRSDVPWGEAEPAREGEECSYGGYFTKDQIREIVAYAAARHIDVVPEIEMPGHSSAILAAYPQFACDNYPYCVALGPYWPPKAILCGGNDSVMVFLKDVFDEVMELFPYEYVHLGGDEAYKDNWRTCPKCQQKIKDLGLANEEELQAWMVAEIEKEVNRHGKKIIGWDEILDGGVTPTATVQSWRGAEGAIKAAQLGNEVVMSPTAFCYFDYYQDEPETQPKAIGGYVPLGKVYAFEPIPDTLTAEQAKCIKGAQCNLWSEFIFTYDHAEYMLLPRLCALAETVWTPKERKDWSRFEAAIPAQVHLLQQLGYNPCTTIGQLAN
ncbi:MAG: beta-N-acetylhexosaminidase [Bacteroidales bacterium]|nr:beta-N-acetylhexosaminidase [Bacteroidales bacterium]